MAQYAIVAQPTGAVEMPLWHALRAGEAASVAELHRACGAHPNAVHQRLMRWVRVGLVEQIDGQPKRFALIDPAHAPARPPSVGRDNVARARRVTAQSKMWRAMRVLRSFDLPTVMMTAGTSRQASAAFIALLARAGYLRRIKRGGPAEGGWAVYRMVRDTGPLAPVVRTVQAPFQRFLVDANTGEQFGAKESTADPDGGVS